MSKGEIMRWMVLGISSVLVILILISLVRDPWKDYSARARSFVEAREFLLDSLNPPSPLVFTYYSGGLSPLALVPEVNVFVPSLVVDLLSPVSGEARLQTWIGQIRSLLFQAVEPEGGVRYFGKMTEPCVYPYDLDDTSLVLKLLSRDLFSSSPPILKEILDHWRHPRGGYRTWLDDPKNYSCIVPGKDPNPVDVGANLHFYLLLKEFHPQAAVPLCTELISLVSNPDHWVWYRYAPLVPFLRIQEAKEKGCPIPFPERLFSSLPAEQHFYLKMAKALIDLEGDPSSSLIMGSRLLKEASAQHFFFFRTRPPVLYHNDPTSSLPRFYYSPQFAFGLWIRIYIRLHERDPHAFPIP